MTTRYRVSIERGTGNEADGDIRGAADSCGGTVMGAVAAPESFARLGADIAVIKTGKSCRE